MKNLNLEAFDVQGMSKYEMEVIDGGGFAYDAGRIIRFMGISLIYGTNVASVDWAVNAS